ncbi:hypothetical protein FHR90_003255 [Endobacter medicaginis]|uniref:Uncharacterized protein n=1 Tax=Endobacter medicaginis TaxID=1181271 RepID=A0A839V4B8_9PROT|nr:hypothetical protein [Endobacter medicaginis]MBB3175400.1 hypothetical protein [Endobacter medicaginis]MCX5476742.1 hypothetical protein [Endobacter medicaginis]NVN29348.1 hypothetical protein [Endobacter medicaginis]
MKKLVALIVMTPAAIALVGYGSWIYSASNKHPAAGDKEEIQKVIDASGSSFKGYILLDTRDCAMGPSVLLPYAGWYCTVHPLKDGSANTSKSYVAFIGEVGGQYIVPIIDNAPGVQSATSGHP